MTRICLSLVHKNSLFPPNTVQVESSFSINDLVEYLNILHAHKQEYKFYINSKKIERKEWHNIIKGNQEDIIEIKYEEEKDMISDISIYNGNIVVCYYNNLISGIIGRFRGEYFRNGVVYKDGVCFSTITCNSKKIKMVCFNALGEEVYYINDRGAYHTTLSDGVDGVDGDGDGGDGRGSSGDGRTITSGNLKPVDILFMRELVLFLCHKVIIEYDTVKKTKKEKKHDRIITAGGVYEDELYMGTSTSEIIVIKYPQEEEVRHQAPLRYIDHIAVERDYIGISSSYTVVILDKKTYKEEKRVEVDWHITGMVWKEGELYIAKKEEIIKIA